METIDFGENFNYQQRNIKGDEFLFKLPDGRFGYVGEYKSKIYFPGISSDMIVDRSKMYNELRTMFNDADYVIDDLMIPIVYALNMYGYKTKFSCEGHSEDTNWYIMFDDSVSIDDVEHLLYDTDGYPVKYSHYIGICFDLFVRRVHCQNSSKSSEILRNVTLNPLSSFNFDREYYSLLLSSFLIIKSLTDNQIIIPGDDSIYNELITTQEPEYIYLNDSRESLVERMKNDIKEQHLTPKCIDSKFKFYGEHKPIATFDFDDNNRFASIIVYDKSIMFQDFFNELEYQLDSDMDIIFPQRISFEVPYQELKESIDEVRTKLHGFKSNNVYLVDSELVACDDNGEIHHVLNYTIDEIFDMIFKYVFKISF